ncbi:glucosaminidase domain-containing protein [Sulfurimonas sp.]
MKKLLIIFGLVYIFALSVYASEYSFRKYNHVKKFYSEITLEAIEISKKHKLPAAAVLAIAGLESGYGSGYVSQITGNILSLGAFKQDRELPSLYLPYSKSKKKVLFDPKEIKKYAKKDLVYKQRPKSLKRDYRPEKYAGSTSNLEFFKYNKELKQQAYKACLNDFATRWIVDSSNIKVFRNARAYLDSLVNEKGNKILFSKSTNKNFIDKIGGIPNSFNYRKTWPKKVKLIMNRTGLVQLVNDINFDKMSFDEAWDNKRL